jgi:hypothetical protein
MNFKPLNEGELKGNASTEASAAVSGCWEEARRTLEAIDFIWTYLRRETRGKWLLR